MGPVGLLLRRQSERAFEQTVTADASALETGLAGLAGYYDENSFFLYGIAPVQGGWQLILEEQIGTERRCTALCRWNAPAAELRVEGTGLRRRLMHREGGAWREDAQIDVSYLSDEGLAMGKRFTGATLGMACIGRGEAVFEDYQERMNGGVV